MLSRVRRLLGSSGGNYAYVVARVRALKTHLLPEDAYARLIARDEHEIARSLQDGRYQQEIDELAHDYSGAILVERATRLNMGREFSRILSWCRGQPQAVLGHYLERFTVYNVKTLLRGAQSGASRADTEAALIPAGIVSMDTWTQAADARDLDECIELLADAPYGSLLVAMKGQPLREIENALDRAHYRHLIEAVPGDTPANQALLRYVKLEVDNVNLKLVLRTKHAGVSDVEIIPGGVEVTQDLARRILAASWSEVPNLVDETRYGAVLKPVLQQYLSDRDLNPVVTALDQHLLEQADQFGHLYPLSILPIIDYVLRKRWEVDRIRIIAFGKRSGLETADIEALVTTA